MYTYEPIILVNFCFYSLSKDGSRTQLKYMRIIGILQRVGALSLQVDGKAMLLLFPRAMSQGDMLACQFGEKSQQKRVRQRFAELTAI